MVTPSLSVDSVVQGLADSAGACDLSLEVSLDLVGQNGLGQVRAKDGSIAQDAVQLVGAAVRSTEQLDSMMQTLPDIADKLSQIDVDALNDVMAKLPATMDAVAQLQQQLNSVASFLGNVGSIFG